MVAIPAGADPSSQQRRRLSLDGRSRLARFGARKNDNSVAGRSPLSMCGICGFVSQDDEETLARMTAVLLHRGPDDSGLYLSQPTADGLRAGLGNRRLAILDLSAAGHMPMSDPERTLWITYNGEIYNYPQLRKELEAKGYRFRSKSDTEAIVYLYQSE